MCAKPKTPFGRTSWCPPQTWVSLTVGLLCAAGAVQAALPEGLAAYYRFNAGSGLTAADETGAHEGTLTGPLQWVEGVDGTALQFRGGNGSPFVNLGAWQTNGPAGLSLALWLKWAGPNSLYQGLVCQRQGTMYWWSELSTDAAQLRFKSNTSPQSNLYLTPPHLLQDEWLHVAFSHDAAAGRGVVYVNGEERLSGTWGLPTGNFANLNVGIGVVNTADGLGTFNGAIDEAMIFQVPLSAADVQAAMRGYANPAAREPRPANGSDDVPADIMLQWTPDASAAAHDVYFSTSPDDVAAADRSSMDGVLVSQGQTPAAYQPPAPLEYGQTYYWRIDEVNGPPANAIFKGDVWSFTVEPYAYPITPVAATASSAQAGMGPERTIDGSGMSGDQHGIDATTMWMSAGVKPNWIQYEFDGVYRLYELWVWNSNQVIESFLGFGARDVAVEYSTDGAAWTALDRAIEFSQAPGAPGYLANTKVSLGGVEARYVRLTINTTWGGVAPQAGLAEVRFFYVPVAAREPQPTIDAKDVELDPALNWRPGRSATSHAVYFGTDPNAVRNRTAPADTVTNHSYSPGPLQFGTTYYWRVDETVDGATYPGEVWSFTAQEYAVIDDFESYTDQAGEEVFTAWIDGFTNSLSGSTVGYFTASGGTFGETKIIHGGQQSMPLQYDNTAAPFLSEAERTFTSAQDWTGNGADSLLVYFRGLAPGFAETASGSILMNAIGTDIWGTADQFRYAYKTLSSDGTMVARVDSVFNSNVWAKAGVMIRQSTDIGSVHAFMPITPGGASAGNGASFQRRLTAGGASTNSDNTGAVVAAPYWVKIERMGSSFSGSISPDGVTWTQLGTAQTIPMTNPVLVGLALCSHDAGIPTSAAFSNVSTTGNVTGNWQVAEIGATQPEGNSAEGLYLAVTDSSGRSKVVQHPDPAATAHMTWQAWTIPVSEFTAAGVKMTAVKSLTLGVGNKAAPKAGGTGTVYIDDIGFGRPVAP